MAVFYSTILFITLLIVLLRSPLTCFILLIIIYVLYPTTSNAGTPDTYRLIAKDIQRIIILVEPRGEELPTEYIDVPPPTTQPEEPCVIDLLQEDSCE